MKWMHQIVLTLMQLMNLYMTLTLVSNKGITSRVSDFMTILFHILEQRTVGERCRRSLGIVSQMKDLNFISPSQVFSDIGNMSPRLLRSTAKRNSITPRCASNSFVVQIEPTRLYKKLNKSNMEVTV